MSQHVRLFAGEKDVLSESDITAIKNQVEKTLGPSTAATRDSILKRRHNLSHLAEELSGIAQEERTMRMDLSTFDKKMNSVLESIAHIEREIGNNRQELRIERQKLFIYERLNEYRSLDSQVQKELLELRLEDVGERLSRMNEIATMLTLGDRLGGDPCANYVRGCYGRALKMTPESFDFAEFPSLLKLIITLRLTRDFVLFFFEFLSAKVLPALSERKAHLNRDDMRFWFSKKAESNNPSGFIATAVSVIEQIISVFQRFSLEICDGDLARYAKTAFSIGLRLPGGDVAELEAAAGKMCMLTRTEPVNVVELMKNARLPLVLDGCRQMLVDGKPFGDVIMHAKTILEGTNDDGVTKNATILAAVIWESDRQKLEAALSTLLAIGTQESFESAAIIDDVLRN